MEINFKGKTALVTGAAGGVGSAMVEQLIKCGARVIAWDINDHGLKALKGRIPNVEIQRVDIADWDATKRAAEQCPPIDLVVNVAAILIPKMLGDIDEKTLDRTMAVNAKAVLNISQVISNRMKAENRGGAIVNVSSTGSTRMLAGNLMYCVSKAAVDAITRALAVELGPHKIRVNCVNPGRINTDFCPELLQMIPDLDKRNVQATPLGRVSESLDVAQAILYLLSDQAAMINGANLTIDGGASVGDSIDSCETF